MKKMQPSRIWMCPIALLLMPWVICLSVSNGQDAKHEEDYYYAQGKKIPVIVALDRVGVLTSEKVKFEGLANLLAPLDLKVLQKFPGNAGDAAVLALKNPLGRKELVNYTRDLRQRGEGKLIRDAGLIVMVKGDTTPMIVTDEFIALFKPEVTREQINELNKENGVEVVRPDRRVKNQFLLRVTPKAPDDALKVSNRYHENKLVAFAHPNFWTPEERFETIPTDPLFANQWHHRNAGQGGGTVGADARTSWAWDLTTGSPNVVIAVIDDGFDLDHEDLAPNVFTNAGEVAGNGVDDDMNGFVDDVNGWDFASGDNNPRPGDATDNHGTAVAGVAVARGGNAIGVSGAAPSCRLLPIRRGYAMFSDQQRADCFAYVQTIAAQTPGTRFIINNSWGHTSPAGVVATVVANAINNAAGDGIIIFFAAGNANTSGFCAASYPSLANVIAVSSSTNQDRKVVTAAFGNCIDILAPSHRGYNAADPFTGTLNVTTTDRTDGAGYNNANPPPLDTTGLTEQANTNYTNFFGGTSSASPLAAGVAGLVLSANSNLTRQQVQRLLQDTADKNEPGMAAYAEVNGFSTPASGVATHSWGRINAFEAVRIAAPVGKDGRGGGKGGVDIFLRDNRLDWGNTDQPSNTLFESVRGFIPHWQSVDIKVDAPPYQVAPGTSAAFDSFTHENARAGEVNRVYVRVRNRGPVTAGAVTVKLHWAFAGLGLPALPTDFWTAFPADSADTTKWHPMGTQNITDLAYSGSSVAGTAADTAQIVQFDFTAPSLDPMNPNPDHHCLLAILDSPQDPASQNTKNSFVVDDITPRDNNVTHRNIKVVDSSEGDEFTEQFYVRNPTKKPIRAVIRFQAPREWHVTLDKFSFGEPFPLAPGQESLVTMKVFPPKPKASGEVTVIQEQFVENKKKVMGGMTYVFGPPKK